MLDVKIMDRRLWVGSSWQALLKGGFLEQELKREGLDSPVEEEKHRLQMLHYPQAWGFLPANTPGLQIKSRRFAG